MILNTNFKEVYNVEKSLKLELNKKILNGLILLKAIIFLLLCGQLLQAKEGLDTAVSKNKSAFTSIDRGLDHDKRSFKLTVSYNEQESNNRKSHISADFVQELVNDKKFEYLRAKHSATRIDGRHAEKSEIDLHLGIGSFYDYHLLLRTKFDSSVSYSNSYSDTRGAGVGVAKVLIKNKNSKLSSYFTLDSFTENRHNNTTSIYESGTINMLYKNKLTNTISLDLTANFSESFTTRDDFFDAKAQIHFRFSENWSTSLQYKFKHRSETLNGRLKDQDQEFDIGVTFTQ